MIEFVVVIYVSGAIAFFIVSLKNCVFGYKEVVKPFPTEIVIIGLLFGSFIWPYFIFTFAFQNAAGKSDDT